jgi:hypothetical protein
MHGILGGFLREAGDYVGFHDLEPWVAATQQFMTEFSREDDCEVCSTAVI